MEVLNNDEKITCQKCGRTLKADNFYTYKDGSKTELCKKCLTLHIDCFEPETFLWLLQKMDVPYIEEEWNILRDKAYAKDPYKVSGTAIFGKYLSKMRLNQWNKYHWNDTDKIAEEQKKKKEKDKLEQERYEIELKKQLEEGKITEAEYKTFISTETQNRELRSAAPYNKVTGPIEGNNRFIEENFISESELPDPAADLTQEDKIYLAVKWGRTYNMNECIELEKKYTEMMNSFDIQDSDTESTLILICKTYLKMNQAIDMGDMDGYQKLSRVYDTLRKSAKFTAAQKKEQQENFVDCVGSLVAYCEKEGGRIPKFEITVDQDIVDTVINDLKDYTSSLIKEDPSLSQQIEDYIKKKEAAEMMKKDKEEAKKKGYDEVQVSDEDYQKHFENIEKDKQLDEEIYYKDAADNIKFKISEEKS